MCLLALSVNAQSNTGSFFNWETAPVHPIALSPSSNTLAVCNLPDNRVEFFDLSSGTPQNTGSVSVGLDPVSVRFRSATELWVVNFISDSISVIDVPSHRVVRTLATTNEPSDVVFAGPQNLAFISCAQPNTIQVFDPTSFLLVTNLTIQGNRPKAMAVSPDRATVYAAVFESGNASTIIGTGVTDLNSLPRANPVNFPSSPSQGVNPPPNNGTNFLPTISDSLSNFPPPRVGLIVKRDASGHWLDDSKRDWSSYISGDNAAFTGRKPGWNMSDHDLAVIDANTFGIRYADGLMNICMDVAVNPATGAPAVVGTDAINEIRFEPQLAKGFVRVNVAQVNPATLTNTIRDLNSHLDYTVTTVSDAERNKSIGDPRGIVWSADGSRGYVTGMGSDNLIIIDAEGRRAGKAPTIDLPAGPTGMALDESRHQLYVYNRFAASVSTVDTQSEQVVDVESLFDPTPDVVKRGRVHLYNTHDSSGLGQAACGSCHVDARFDRLAWDLGDPTADRKVITPQNVNFARFPPAVTNDFHPMKGPMVTQTLVDIIGHEPFHWRGDRDGIEQFNATFTNLQARATELATNEMEDLKGFLATVRFAPNPYRQFDNSLPTNLPLPGYVALGRGKLPFGAQLPNGNAQAGMTNFRLQSDTGCSHCHALPTGLGPDFSFNGTQFFPFPVGSNNVHHAAIIELNRSFALPFKIAQLRNLFDKTGVDFNSTNSISGFGFLHDGSVDTLTRFLQDGFAMTNDQQCANMIAFLLSVTGSDLPAGSVIDPNRPPGLPGNDTAAAVGRQRTITTTNQDPLIDSMISLANSSVGRVDLVVKTSVAGIERGWVYDMTTRRFQSDRRAETLLATELRLLAATNSAQTYTLVPRGAGRRIGIDRDEDGHFDGDEADYGSDTADVASYPPLVPATFSSVNLTTNGVALTWSGTPGYLYRIEVRTNLATDQWQPLGTNVIASLAPLSQTDTNLTVAPQKYYRIVTSP